MHLASRLLVSQDPKHRLRLLMSLSRPKRIELLDEHQPSIQLVHWIVKGKDPRFFLADLVHGCDDLGHEDVGVVSEEHENDQDLQTSTPLQDGSKTARDTA
jgi:hypothetical protein